MEETEKTNSAKGAVAHVQTLRLAATALSVTAWGTANFAPEWFSDALSEARRGIDIHSRRREILFAVCCAESYLLEWVRDEVLNHDYRLLSEYFPSGKKRGVTQKWKEIPKQLYTDGRISNLPDYGAKWWQDLRDLISYRDGLIHAQASRPDSSSVTVAEKPVPTGSQLQQLSPGWAVRVTINAIEQLHKAAGTATPNWLIEP